MDEEVPNLKPKIKQNNKCSNDEYDLQCPICFEKFVDAVVVKESGHTYCEICIKRHFAISRDSSKITDPNTGKILKSTEIGPNWAIRKLIV